MCEWAAMASYFRWIKGSKKEEALYQKPRSRSLDAKSLELSGIRLLLHHVGTNSLLLLLIATSATPGTSCTEWLRCCCSVTSSPEISWGCNSDARILCDFNTHAVSPPDHCSCLACWTLTGPVAVFVSINFPPTFWWLGLTILKERIVVNSFKYGICCKITSVTRNRTCWKKGAGITFRIMSARVRCQKGWVDGIKDYVFRHQQETHKQILRGK
jgi:hypothetical protein